MLISALNNVSAHQLSSGVTT